MLHSPGQLIERSREHLRLSSKELAHLVGISQSYLSRIIAGDRMPPLDEEKLKRWEKALRMSAADARVFREAVHLAHATPVVRRLVQQLLAQLRSAERRARRNV